MPKRQLSSSGVAIVVLGGFNPRIFEPAWLAQQQLIPEDEAREADTQLISGHFARIELPWATLNVDDGRLDLVTGDEIVQPDQIRDLTLGVLRLLPHTPVRRMAVNRFSHFRVSSEEAWHQIGDRLTPKDVWSDVLSQPGMGSVEITSDRTDGRNGRVNVTIEPSGTIHPGIYINVNDDVLLDDDKLPEPAGRLADILEEYWPETADRAERIVSAVLSCGEINA